jgi:TRAP-type C4-dicarboxylate transport system substrate-binding protein
MSSIRATERQMRKLQQQRHLYDIKLMVLNNPLFKNLSERDQKTLVKLIYKAEMIEVFMRDRQIMRVNDSFDDIVESVANMINDVLDQDDDEDFDGPDRRKDF